MSTVPSVSNLSRIHVIFRTKNVSSIVGSVGTCCRCSRLWFGRLSDSTPSVWRRRRCRVTLLFSFKSVWGQTASFSFPFTRLYKTKAESSLSFCLMFSAGGFACGLFDISVRSNWYSGTVYMMIEYGVLDDWERCIWWLSTVYLTRVIDFRNMFITPRWTYLVDHIVACDLL